MKQGIRTLVVLVVGMLLAACSAGDDTSTIAIVEPKDDRAIRGNTVRLVFDLKGQKVGGDTGRHVEVVLDAPAPKVGERQRKRVVAHAVRDKHRLTGIPVGDHVLAAYLVDEQHRRLEGEPAQLEVRVQGPSVVARILPPDGPRVKVGISVEGVKLAAPGSRGLHLHVLVDRDPLDVGEAIPQSPDIIHTDQTVVELPELPNGVHRLVVLLGDKDEKVAEPLTMDRVSFTAG